MLRASTRGRLVGLLADGAEDGWYPTTTAQRRSVTSAARDAEALVAHLGHVTATVVDLLRGAGLDPVVLKGPAHRALLEVVPGRRAFGDVDVLVSPAELDAAGEVLSSAGGHRSFRPPRPGFDRRFWKGGVFEFADGTFVDLHCRLTVGALGLGIHHAALTRGARPFVLDRGRCLALGAEAMLVHTTLDCAVAGSPSARSLRDLALALRQPELDAPRALALADAWQVTVALRRAVEHLDARFGRFDDTSPASDVAAAARRARTRRGDRIRLAPFVADRHGHALALASVAWALPPSELPAFLGSVAVPSRDSGRRGLLWRVLPRREGATRPASEPTAPGVRSPAPATMSREP